MKWLAPVWVSSLCPAGFFGMWTFSRSNKQTGPPTKKVTDVPNIRMLELTGDLIGHSGAVQVRFTSYELFCFVVSQQRFNDLLLVCQMFVNFGENGLVTCSADHLLILWKNGERQSHLRSLALFEKLEESGGLWPLTSNRWVAALRRAEVMLSMLLMIYCDDCLYWMIMWWLLFVSSLNQSIKLSSKNSK